MVLALGRLYTIDLVLGTLGVWCEVICVREIVRIWYILKSAEEGVIIKLRTGLLLQGQKGFAVGYNNLVGDS